MTENTLRMARVSIGELSQRTGVPVRTLRFYCDNGILEARRSGGGHRVFDAAVAVDQVLLIRRLRALGLSLPAIVEILAGTLTIDEAVTAERTALDTELGRLAWRRASLRAVEDAPPAERPARVELLAAVQDRHRAYDDLIRSWKALLHPLPPDLFDGFVTMNIPRPPADPTPRQVVAYAELTRSADPTWTTATAGQLWRTERAAIPDKLSLVTGVAAACESVDALCAAGAQPIPGPELDGFVAAHAAARRTRDTPGLRRELLAGPAADHPAIHRYWRLTTEITGTTTTGAALHWLLRALERWSTEQAGR